MVADPGTGIAWVADTGNHAIRRIAANGEVTTFAGTLGVGGSVDGQGAAALFLSPTGITRDGAGNLYVTDAQMHVVRAIKPDGTVTTIAGFAGLSGSADGTGSGARFKNPSGIAAMTDGTLYVADTNNFTIRKITPQGVVTTVAGVAGTFGHDDTVQGQPATFFGPSGVAVTSTGTVFVADTANHIIRSISPTGVVTTIAGQPQQVGFADGAANAALFDSPQHLSYSESDGALYIADSINDAVRRLAGGAVTTIAGQPHSVAPVDGEIDTARLVLPIGVAIASATTLYVTDNNFSTVRSVSLNGAVTTIAGQARQTEGVSNPAGFIHPGAIAAIAGQPDTLWVTDSSDHTVRAVTQGSVSIVAGKSGVPGANYGTALAPGTDPLLHSPSGVSAHGLVADTGNNAIARIDLTSHNMSLLSGALPPDVRGFVDGSATAARFGGPSGMSDGPDDTYVADLANHAIRKISRTDGSVTTLAGDGTFGSDDGLAPHFNHPKAVLYVGDGVIVADTDNHAIRKVLFNGETITLTGRAGEPGSADGDAATARFSSPAALAADAAGNIYIADAGNFTIRKLTPAGVVTTVAGKVGVEGFTPGDVGVLSAIRGLAVGTDGALYATMYQGIAKVVLP
jgi:sugar lactone lactonase YvrE